MFKTVKLTFVLYCIFDHVNSNNHCLSFLIRGQDSSGDEGGEDKGGRDIKLILVVRNDLKMGKGKVAAQVCWSLLFFDANTNR